MPKPYSQDLRERVVAAVEGGLSRCQAALFDVGVSTVIESVRRAWEMGVLSGTRLSLDDQRLRLSLTPEVASFMGDVVERRLDALAQSFNREAAVETAA